MKDLVVFHYKNQSESEIQMILLALNSNPLIQYAKIDPIIKGAYVPTDSLYTNQGNMTRIAMDQVWEYSRGREDVVVAVLDTGIDYTHPDLFQCVVPGYDFCNDDDDPYDDSYNSYHGTHIAGIIAARGNNGLGIAGVGWKIKIMPLKVLDHNVDGYLSDAVEAIDYATAHGVSVINASWGRYNQDDEMIAAIERARDAGIIFVAAAGNGGKDEIGDSNDDIPFYPASYDYDNIIAVANTDNSTPEENLALSSNYGPASVDIAAPGETIMSTMGQNRYQTKSGTSMAAPHVAGAAAILKSVYPDLQYHQIINALISNVDRLTTLDGMIKSGGRLNVYKALTSLGLPPLDPPVPEALPALPEQRTDLLLMYRCIRIQEISSMIHMQIMITNRDINPITLSDITCRYYYTREGTAEEIVEFDYASIPISNIIITPQNDYLDICFSQNAGILSDPNSVIFYFSVHMTDYPDYDQSNDFSFDPTCNDYTYHDKITMYKNGKLIWGYGPEGPTPSPTPYSEPSPTPMQTIVPTTNPTSIPTPDPTIVMTPVPTAAPTPEPTPGETPQFILLGDVNSDGLIDVVDALLVAQYYVGITPVIFIYDAADVNCDQAVDIQDSLIISRYYVKLISELC